MFFVFAGTQEKKRLYFARRIEKPEATGVPRENHHSSVSKLSSQSHKALVISCIGETRVTT